jgi:hypothetical protein
MANNTIFYDATLRRYDSPDYKETIHIISRVPLTVEMLASINSRHEEEIDSYILTLMNYEELVMLMGPQIQYFHMNDDFCILKVIDSKHNRMEDAPEWVIRRPQDDYYSTTRKVVGAGVWS